MDDMNAITGMDEQLEIGDSGETSWSIVRIWQRIKVELEAHELNTKGGNEEIWALVELAMFDPDQTEPLNQPSKRTKKWKKFDSEAELVDYIRRDTGEPLTLPPYSLTPQQSARIQEEAKKNVSKITEDFRRFRVKSEMVRKQAETQIKEMQNKNVESVKRRIEGQDAAPSDRDTERSETSRLERMRSEMTRQEAQWKEAYDVLLAENNALKSPGSEALLASQWRQRYETCLGEKEEAENQLKLEKEKAEAADAGKYEMKYRDLKESFRLYRKKAKEIFEAQQAGRPSVRKIVMFLAVIDTVMSQLNPIFFSKHKQTQIMQMSEKSSEDSKLSYLKNLMVNYLTSDLAVREHMEGAIGTILQFTPEDIEKIEQKKNESGYWGLF